MASESASPRISCTSSTLRSIRRISIGCTIPGRLLNNGLYTITAYVVGPEMHDVAAEAKDALTFNIRDTGFMKREVTCDWLGVIRVQLDWRTQPCGALD